MNSRSGSRYAKAGLLAFGFGLLLGLAALAAEVKPLERVASGLMAFGIAGIPLGMVADWWRATKAANTTRRGAKTARRQASRNSRRQRKVAMPKR
ncbi:MAG: hypothetical protein JO320_07975, partial [Alphaproteobacteria bacterium]|nr:hypothetical protein [Alphaproteobacteria bacterium]MBV9200009.1 hypothetical protein [Alphaproteobacteria bacterium]MBV9374975.1 hypothetical protein [Alphaproteobacteria bacterium]